MSVVSGQLSRAAFELAPLCNEYCARAAFLVSPEGFSLAVESATDNRYMGGATADSSRALAQHRLLQRRLAERLPVVAFHGDPATPDAVFPNNVFATARVDNRGRLLIGRMRHPVRQREAERDDIPRFFQGALGYQVCDLRSQPGLTELTGTLIIDRARRVGFAGLSPRCDAVGVATMAAAFGLSRCVQFLLAQGEYHTNVVLSVLASRALVVCPDGFADAGTAAMLASLYAPHVIELDADEKAGFAGNCIALDGEVVWMSERAADSLRGGSLVAFERAGFRVASVPLDEIEKAGGSLRCCVAEIF